MSLAPLPAYVARANAQQAEADAPYSANTERAFLKYGATASLSDFSVKMGPGSYYEVPFGHRGQIDGIWEADAGGTMRITEFTS